MWNLFWSRKPRDKFSLENLRALYEELISYPIIHDHNKNTVVEIVRSIAEVMIWGDQHNDQVFYFFCEKNILAHFIRILSHKLDRQITIQILQTLSIMIQNFSRQESMYYLLSNNHINDLILHPFDFGDEEIIAYYISFLKTLSLKLNPNTLQFFFNKDEGSFPLYSQAIQFFHHPEAMVRIAVRTITLNVYQMDDPALRQFIVSTSAVSYFSNLVWFIRDQILQIDGALRSSSPLQVMGLMEVQLDGFHYLEEILLLKVHGLGRLLEDRLLGDLILPIIIGALLHHHHHHDRRPPISLRLALFLLLQLFHVFTDRDLVNSTVVCILHESPPEIISQLTITKAANTTATTSSLCDLLYTNVIDDEGAEPTTSNRARMVLLEALADPSLTIIAGGVLLALLRNPSIDTTLLARVQVCPQRLLRRRRLLNAVLEADRAPDVEETSATDRARTTSQGDDLSVTADYATDVIDSAINALESHPSIAAIPILTLLMSELVHLDGVGLAHRHSLALINVFRKALGRLCTRPEYHQLIAQRPEEEGGRPRPIPESRVMLDAFWSVMDEEEVTTALSLSELSEPTTLLVPAEEVPNDDHDHLRDDIRRVIALHPCVAALADSDPITSVSSPADPTMMAPSQLLPCRWLSLLSSSIPTTMSTSSSSSSFTLLHHPDRALALHVPFHAVDVVVGDHDVVDVVVRTRSSPSSRCWRSSSSLHEGWIVRLRFDDIDRALEYLHEGRTRSRHDLHRRLDRWWNAFDPNKTAC